MGITGKIFVLKRSDTLYDRVANIYDLVTDPLPDSPTDGLPYYRASSFVISFSFEERAIADSYESVVPGKVDRLMELLNLTEFTGTASDTYPTS